MGQKFLDDLKLSICSNFETLQAEYIFPFFFFLSERKTVGKVCKKLQDRRGKVEKVSREGD